MSEGWSFPLAEIPVHLGLGATVIPQERLTRDVAWYQQYAERNAGDGAEGRLVSMHTFKEPWDSWEMHPNGQELVVCTEGEITLYQEIDDRVGKVVLKAGQAVINPSGSWHTADVSRESTALFITAGLGTEIRPR